MKDKSRLLTVGLAILIAIVTFLATYFEGSIKALNTADASVADLLGQRRRNINTKIVIIGIDDATLSEYGAITSWSRETYAKLLDTLNTEEYSPAVIGFDILFSEQGEEAGDAAFAETVAKYDNVVLADMYHFKLVLEHYPDGSYVKNPYHIEYVIRPYEELAENVEIGFANTVMDDDGFVRGTFLSIDGEYGKEYSLAWKIYEKYARVKGLKATMPTTYTNQRIFNFAYYGKPKTYSCYSLSQVLDGSVSPQLLDGAIVLVGAYAEGMQDNYPPAISHDSQMYGVEIHANIVNALMDGKTQVPVNILLYSIISALAAAGFFFLLTRSKVLKAAAFMAGFIIADIIAYIILFELGWLIPVLILPIMFILMTAVHITCSYLLEAKRRRQVTGAFKQYVAPQIVEKISKDKNFKLVLGGENRHIACLFVDIRGFTTMSESLEPEQVVEILNEYLALTTKSILDNGGTLDKFVGDATMAVFNAPFDLEDYVYKAVCAARDMRAGSQAITEKFTERFGKSVSFGIGVNCGPAVVGNIGCDFRMDYTAIGDTVNTAARLESNAKSGQILISEYVYEIIKDRVEVTPIGEIPLKGKKKGVFVYQVDEVK